MNYGDDDLRSRLCRLPRRDAKNDAHRPIRIYIQQNKNDKPTPTKISYAHITLHKQIKNAQTVHQTQTVRPSQSDILWWTRTISLD